MGPSLLKAADDTRPLLLQALYGCWRLGQIIVDVRAGMLLSEVACAASQAWFVVWLCYEMACDLPSQAPIALVLRTAWLITGMVLHPLRLLLGPVLRLVMGPLHSLASFTFVAESERMNKIARVIGQQVHRRNVAL